MHSMDLNKVVFYSKEDLAAGHQLRKAERILRAKTKLIYSDINEVLELFNIKKYIDNDCALNSWTIEDLKLFKEKAKEYGKIVGNYMGTINDSNVTMTYNSLLQNYIHSFWELVTNNKVYEQISKASFKNILVDDPFLIHEVLKHKKLVHYFDVEIKDFLLRYSKSAEILISVYEVKEPFFNHEKFIPKSLTIEDKENIISSYLDSTDTNLNYVGLIQNARNQSELKISDKTRLKAKRLHDIETEKILSQNSEKRGVSIRFIENAPELKSVFIDNNLTVHYSYSLDHIRQNSGFYELYKNFKLLFEYVDAQNRINLVNKNSQMDILEKIIGLHSQKEYITGQVFSLNQMSSQGQIMGYHQILSDSNISLETILNSVYTSVFQEKYTFANNAYFSVPTQASSSFEKIRILAPEFESVLKQFKLFVEDGKIDYELLQISSAPSAIKDIPSLNANKYVYFNKDNKEMVGCSNLFFSDQTLLNHVEPFKNKNYKNFFDLIINEDVLFDNYEEYQKPNLNYLISNELITINADGFVKISNLNRLLILNDLYKNEVASFHHYTKGLQNEIHKMFEENILFFENTLFSKPEQAYFNFFLNKSEFTNGLDLRNSYLHGTQAKSDEMQKHDFAYFKYLKLLFLVMLKIEDDLMISQKNKLT